jgi:uncharacterized protein
MIGRTAEEAILQAAMQSSESEMIAVTGRRRVGKTYLIKTVYQKQMVFYMTGTQHATKETQLFNFTEKLQEYSKKKVAPHTQPANWAEAFALLTQYLQKNKSPYKQVIFFDELPWLATKRSNFTEALGYFWNNWASTANVVVVICGSAASWMMDNIINQKGGLHNRVTKLIKLDPFTLNETAAFLKSKKVTLDKYQIVQIYMAMGGIPHYLNEIVANETAIQNIGRIGFTKTGLLRNEFDNLYAALFEYHQNHIAIITVLSSKWKGLTRSEIIKLTKFTNGGGLTKVLQELEASSFISTYLPFDKKKREALYRLTDEYSLFYLKFIAPQTSYKVTTWLQLTKTAAYTAWSGYAFESLCLKHVAAIKKALGIPAVYTQESSFVAKGSRHTAGTQIDLLIDREDRAINICEMKFTTGEFTINRDYANKLRQKREIFRQVTTTKKQLFLTLVCTYGLQHNQYSLGLIDQVIPLDELFVEI